MSCAPAMAEKMARARDSLSSELTTFAADSRVVELLGTGVLSLCYDAHAQCGNNRLSLTPRKELP